MVSALLPEAKDVWDVWTTLRYHVGLSAQRPQFGRFNYGEKFEYWALVWGTMIMAGTGLMAWFQLTVTRFLPGWWIDVALTIHLYEAILATLAILLWHFYQVMFDPDVYPMNWSWWTGRMPLEHYKDEHSLDSETILHAMQQQANDSGAEEERNVHDRSAKSADDSSSKDKAES
jgi:cytochrome b subunit of formate dehydrogenase